MKKIGNAAPEGNVSGRLILVNIIFRCLKHYLYSTTLQYQHTEKHLGFILLFLDALQLFPVSSLKVTWSYLNTVGFFWFCVGVFGLVLVLDLEWVFVWLVGFFWVFLCACVLGFWVWGFFGFYFWCWVLGFGVFLRFFFF